MAFGCITADVLSLIVSVGPRTRVRRRSTATHKRLRLGGPEGLFRAIWGAKVPSGPKGPFEPERALRARRALPSLSCLCVAIDRESDKEEQVAAIQQELAALGSAVQTLGGASQAGGGRGGRAEGGG